MNTLEAHAPIASGGPSDRLLPWPKVRDMTGLSRTTAWRRQKAGDFPLAVRISPGRVGWWESELTAWKASRLPSSEARAELRIESRTPPRPEPRALRPAPPPDPPRPAPQTAPAPEPSKRRRKLRTCEGQIAFEF